MDSVVETILNVFLDQNKARNMIYLDNNATTQPYRNMLGAAFEVCHNTFGNPSSQHVSGQESKKVIREARSDLASLITADPASIIFTSGGTESNNIILQNVLRKKGKVICSDLEHSSIYEGRTHALSVNDKGLIDIDRLECFLKVHAPSSYKNIVVAVMLANNETGIITPNMFDIASLCNKYNVHLHIDAVQALGKLPINCKDYNQCSISMSFSAHKIHGLKGAGALYMNDMSLERYKFMYGGSHEFGLRAGTENQIGIYSFGYMANKLINDSFYKRRVKEIEKKRDKLEFLLKDITEVNGCECERTPNTSNLYFPKINDADLLVEMLSMAGVYVSSGSACSSGLPGPSRVLVAMYGKENPRVNGSIRISLSVDTTYEQIEKAAKIIKEVINNGVEL